MAAQDVADVTAKALNLSLITFGILLTACLWRVFYMQKLHPLSGFPGPWYATSFSVVGAIVSVMGKEPEWMMYLVKRYGSETPHDINEVQVLIVYSGPPHSFIPYVTSFSQAIGVERHLQRSTVQPKGWCVPRWGTGLV